MKLLRFLLLMALAVSTSSCAWHEKYRRNINQGNLLKPAKVAQLRKGMSPKQVAFLLGTPIYVNTFQPNRWVYVHYTDKGFAPAHIEQLIIDFQHQHVVKISHSKSKIGSRVSKG